ncbi:MAG: MerR family transcriptional regulator [Actinomycetaceae bacterium]|nr:MerR family transcriptional regulator [Actinomycetaceae bacterium]
MLSISQLANYVGVTVKAIRHYHRIGLLPEPSRNSLGHREYDGHAVLTLQRIKVLSEAGVSLGKITALLRDPQCSMEAELDAIEKDLDARITELIHTRSRLQELRRDQEGAFLPEMLRRLHSRLKELGFRKDYIRTWTEGWVLLCILLPEFAEKHIPLMESVLDDEEYMAILFEEERVLELPVGHPDIAALAQRVAQWIIHKGLSDEEYSQPDLEPIWSLAHPVFEITPAEEELQRLIEAQVTALRESAPPS